MTADVRQACADLITAFAYHVDHHEFDRAAALFAPDGRFERPDLDARGHVAIAAIWADRPRWVVTRHLCGTPFFISIVADCVTSVTNFTLYHLNHEGSGIPRFDRPAAVAEFHDEFRLVDNAWRIAHRRGVPIMIPG